MKKLKQSLASAGLVQPQISKKKSKRQGKTTDKMTKDDRQNAISQIRSQFNPFDNKVVRNKREDAIAKKQTVGKPGISKQAGEDRRKLAHEAKLARKNKIGGIVDRRFGENDRHLTAEEKMLERFTKAKLAQSKKSMYNLDDDDEDKYEDDGFNTLTHKGMSLADEFEDNVSDNSVDSEDEADFFSKKRPTMETSEEGEPERKKTKAEVMKEVMAKSKYYKQLRQKSHKETMGKVGELDDNFADVMDEISTIAQKLPVKEVGKDLEYEMKVTEAKLDRKAAPTDRTKTDEELAAEEAERLKKLQDERQRRMEGEEDENATQVDRGGDDLGDDYWEAGSDGDEAEGFAIHDSEDEFAQSDIESENEEENEALGRVKGEAKNTITIGNKVFYVKKTAPTVVLTCPFTLEEFRSLLKEQIKSDPETYHSDVLKLILQIFEKYQPKLSEGNKSKLGKFSCVLLRYQFELLDSETEHNDDYIKLMEFLSRATKDLATKYPSEFLEVYRELINDAQERLESSNDLFPKPSDLLMLSQIGRTFSTSDRFHLVVVPALVLAAEALESMAVTPRNIVAGIYICDVLLQYQRIAKRFVPEVLSFLERSLVEIVPSPSKLDINKLLTQSIQVNATKLTLSSQIELPTENNHTPQSLTQLLTQAENNFDKEFSKTLLLLILRSLDQTVSQIWKETESIPEILMPFTHIMQNLIKFTKPIGNPLLINMANKLTNITKLAQQTRKPLTLQSHRAMAIATFAPKFDESFNPDNKHAASKYVDPNDSASVNNEIAKLKHQIKQERKQTIREIRKDNKFEARVQIDTQKKKYAEYHAKMANIVNTIQAEEGTEKNLHEKEKRRRKDAKR